MIQLKAYSTTTHRLTSVPAAREIVLDQSQKQIYLGDGVTLGGVAYNPPATQNSTLTYVISTGNVAAGFVGNIAANQFMSNTAISGLSLGTSVTVISSSAFQSCTKLAGSLNIPSSVTSIGSYAFYRCSGFTGSLNIPSSVTSIGGNAFSNCSGFTGSLNIPSSVTSIGGSAFQNCSGFTGSLNIPSSVTSIGNNAFRNGTNLSGVRCSVTRTIMNATNCLFGTSVTSLSARISDVTWTAGADTIGGKALTVYKVL